MIFILGVRLECVWINHRILNIDLCNLDQTSTIEPQIEDTLTIASGDYGKETYCTGKRMHKWCMFIAFLKIHHKKTQSRMNGHDISTWWLCVERPLSHADGGSFPWCPLVTRKYASTHVELITLTLLFRDLMLS